MGVEVFYPETQYNYNKPILVRLVLKVGKPINGARIQIEAPTIEGFLPIESPDVKGATQYIAVDNIASFTVIDEETVNLMGCFPIPKVKVKECTTF